MVYKNGLRCSDIDWKSNPTIRDVSIESKGLLLEIEKEDIDCASDEIMMNISGYGKNKIKALKKELRESGLFVTQKTRDGFDYYIGFDAVNFYINRYGKTLDPTRVSLKYESKEEKVYREEMELVLSSNDYMDKVMNEAKK